MKTLAFFNNKGGVGKTSLVYHLGWMFAGLGVRVLVADLDPQANLTAMCFSADALEAWLDDPNSMTVARAIDPLKRGVGDIAELAPWVVGDNLGLVPGDLDLSAFEDDLSSEWPGCVDRKERAFRVTTAFHRIIDAAGRAMGADLCLIDVGPNFGAINRAALIAAEHVLIPVAPDLFSVTGLRNVGGKLKTWRDEWQDRLARKPQGLEISLPTGAIRPIGYIVSRHSQLADGTVRAFQKWIDRIPYVYREAVENPDIPDAELSVGRLKDYRSLIAMAQDARKPMFLLKPGDGAIGGHQSAVTAAADDFEAIAREVARRIELPLP